MSGFLVRDNSYAIEKIHKVISSKQVTASRLSFAPSWILQQASQKEHKINWFDAYVGVKEEKVLRDANMITKYVVTKSRHLRMAQSR